MSAAHLGVDIVAGDMVTALGVGTETCWRGLLENRCGLKPDTRFYPTDPSQCYPVGAVSECEDPSSDDSRFMRLISLLLPGLKAALPEDAQVILATTIGEIDLLENEVLTGAKGKADGDPQQTLIRVREALGVRRPVTFFSAACASSTGALALGAERIGSGRASCVCVLGCDALSEFAYSGFLSLQALSKENARPFAPDRDGLNLGEAAGYALLMSPDRARSEGRAILGSLAGWGQSCDAVHMTTPAQDGAGLARAVTRALQSANLEPDRIGAICAHGTGTVFNDAMEEAAFQTVFGKPPPFFSVKGAIGHTLGAAGVVETGLLLHALRESRTPPTVGNPGLPGQTFQSVCALTTNSGFGGINAALVLRRGGEAA